MQRLLSPRWMMVKAVLFVGLGLLALTWCIACSASEPTAKREFPRNWERALEVVMDEEAFVAMPTMLPDPSLEDRGPLKLALVVAWMYRGKRDPHGFVHGVVDDAGRPYEFDERVAGVVVWGVGRDGVSGSDDDDLGIVVGSRSDLERVMSTLRGKRARLRKRRPRAGASSSR